jgi:putative membrane protein
MWYNNYFGGMHFIWWVFWVMMIIWIFAIPYNIPGQRFKVASPLETLKNRLASGQITMEQYQEMKKLLKSN